MIRWHDVPVRLLLAGDGTSKVNELGPVKVTTTLSPAEPTLGDEITLEIRVEAEPQVEVLMPEFGEALNRYTILNFVPRQRIDDDGKIDVDPAVHAAAVPVGPAVDSADSHRVRGSSTGTEARTGRCRRLRDPDRSHRFPGPVGCSRGCGARTEAPFGELDLLAEHARSNTLWAMHCTRWPPCRRMARGVGGCDTADGRLAAAMPTRWLACDSISCYRARGRRMRRRSSVLRRDFVDRAAVPGGPLRAASAGIDDRGVSGSGGFGQPLVRTTIRICCAISCVRPTS